jgi:hypothetical protein
MKPAFKCLETLLTGAIFFSLSTAALAEEARGKKKDGDKTEKKEKEQAPADDKSGVLFSWVVTRDGKTVGEESVRVVNAASGNVFASGELELKGSKKTHRKSHLQRDPSGRIVRYQRVEAGLKGSGLRVFEWKEQMRIAPINASGKPSDIGELPSGRIWDADLWHLMHLWGLPKSCSGAKLAYYDPGKQAAGEASLSCAGAKKVFDDKKKAVDVHVLSVSGVPAEGLELWVDGNGHLIGAKNDTRMMLKARYSAEAGKAADVVPEDEGEDGKAQIRDRGVGE